MALLFMDSFDHYVTADILSKWTALTIAPTIVAGAGRNGTAGMRMGVSSSANVAKGLATSGSTLVAGWAFKPVIVGQFLLEIGESGTCHVGVWIGLDGSLQVMRLATAGWASSGGTVLATSAAGLITVGTYYHLQLKVTISDTVGTVDIRLNNVSVLSATALDTRNGGTGVATIVYLGGNCDNDDFWVCDTTGSAPWNDFLGDCRVDARFPTAAGATTGWTPSTGANWAAVDDAAPNGDTDYVAATTTVTDTYTVQDSPSVGATIYGVQHCLYAKKVDAGVASIAPVVRHSGTDNVGANLQPSTSYGYLLAVNQTNPGTAAQWTEANFNAAEFGIKRTA